MRNNLAMLENCVSVSELGRGCISKALSRTKDGPMLVLKNNSPVAVVLSMEDYGAITEQLGNLPHGGHGRGTGAGEGGRQKEAQ